MSEITTYTAPSNDLAQQVQFAQLVTEGDPRGSLLPQAYRGQPGNVLIAVGLGAAMGLSPAESLYRIDVIQGTPTASAELIAQNVRKAGHKLRVRISENPPTATATIIRSDDPDEPISITRDMAWAKQMGLAGKDNYTKQPATMLSWRAITAAARLACPEALYGVAYTAEEVEGQTVRGTATVSVADEFAASSRPDPAPATFSESPEGDTADVEDAVEVDETGEAPSDAAVRAMFAAFGEAGFTGDARSAEGRQVRLDYIGQVIGREVASSKGLTAADVSRVIDALKADAEGSAS